MPVKDTIVRYSRAMRVVFGGIQRKSCVAAEHSHILPYWNLVGEVVNYCVGVLHVLSLSLALSNESLQLVACYRGREAQVVGRFFPYLALASS